jgi:hypothetical protein
VSKVQKQQWIALGTLLLSLASLCFAVGRVPSGGHDEDLPRPRVPAHSPNAIAPEKAVHRDSLEKVTFGGELNGADYTTIRRLIAEHSDLVERNITTIEVRAPGKIEVRTGPKHPKPLSGGGDIVTMERQGDGWKITEIQWWVG